MAPTIGRIVLYHTTEKQRTDMKNSQNCNEALLLPAMVVAVWSPTTINLKVEKDGEGCLWVTSAMEGVEEGQWEWPRIETKPLI